jgi:hypothetical protein
VSDKSFDQMSDDEIRAAVGAGVPGAAKAYAETHRILCAHADDDGRGAHWLEPGEKCAAAPDREAGSEQLRLESEGLRQVQAYLDQVDGRGGAEAGQ